MPKEIELKLRLKPAQAGRLPQQAVLAGVTPQKYRLFNTYYDTPGQELRQRGIALRLRRKGRSLWLMTVKGGDSAASALAQRSEWEAPVQPGTFDFGIVTDAALREFLKSREKDLQPVFSTNFTRTAWTLAPCQGTVVEMALDKGRIDAGAPENGASCAGEPICELELELIEGESPDALFDIAIMLAADLHLHPEIASKAERGYALLSPSPGPVKSPPLPMERGMPVPEAFRAVALSCLQHLQRNEAGAVQGLDPEYVHQARVAIRRLRSALKLFAPALAPAFIGVYAPRWNALASQLGSVRDWDVFITETLEPLEKAFPGDPDLAHLRERSRAIQAQAQSSASLALSQPDYSRLLLAFTAALFRAEPPTIDAGGKPLGKLSRFAVQLLRKRAGSVRKLARRHASMDDAQRHRLRIAFKKLRYAVEFFAPLLPGKRLKAYQKGLSSIQDLLGLLNDQVTAERLIGELHPEGGPAPLPCGWIAGRKHLLIQSLDAELGGFVALRPPW